MVSALGMRQGTYTKSGQLPDTRSNKHERLDDDPPKCPRECLIAQLTELRLAFPLVLLFLAQVAHLGVEFLRA